MRIAILFGSPHKAGTTAKLVESFVRGAEEAGHKVAKFDVARMHIHPCIACNTCKTSYTGACATKDDMIALCDELTEVDCIVFATPIYYFTFPAQLKVVIDRFYAIEDELRNIKKSALITAMAGTDEDAIDMTNKIYKSISAWLEWEDRGIVNALGCMTPDQINPDDFRKAYELGYNL